MNFRAQVKQRDDNYITHPRYAHIILFSDFHTYIEYVIEAV